MDKEQLFQLRKEIEQLPKNTNDIFDFVLSKLSAQNEDLQSDLSGARAGMELYKKEAKEAIDRAKVYVKELDELKIENVDIKSKLMAAEIAMQSVRNLIDKS